MIVQYSFKGLMSLAPTNEESAWLHEEQNLNSRENILK
jgi:hypothetical protein